MLNNVEQTVGEQEMQSGSRLLIGASLGLISTSFLIMILVVVADLYIPLKDWLKTVFIHHWIGKGVLALVFFILSLTIGLFVSPTGTRERRLLSLSLWAAAISATVITLFFVYEAFLR